MCKDNKSERRDMMSTNRRAERHIQKVGGGGGREKKTNKCSKESQKEGDSCSTTLICASKPAAPPHHHHLLSPPRSVSCAFHFLCTQCAHLQPIVSPVNNSWTCSARSAQTEGKCNRADIFIHRLSRDGRDFALTEGSLASVAPRL